MQKQIFSRKAFTLVELIVIVSISALLLTVTMLITGCGNDSGGSGSSSGSSGSKGALDNKNTRAACISKLNDFGKAIMMYADVNKGFVPVWDGENRNNLATNDNNVYDTQDAASIVTPGNKILLGGYMGMNLTSVTKDAAKKTFACPSDGNIYDGKQASSYIYMPVNSKSYNEYPKRRVIEGRDNPGAALMYDMHSALVAGDTGANAKLPKKGGNHTDSINVLYFGGHTGQVRVKSDQKVTFKELDQITY